MCLCRSAFHAMACDTPGHVRSALWAVMRLSIFIPHYGVWRAWAYSFCTIGCDVRGPYILKYGLRHARACPFCNMSCGASEHIPNGLYMFASARTRGICLPVGNNITLSVRATLLMRSILKCCAGINQRSVNRLRWYFPERVSGMLRSSYTVVLLRSILKCYAGIYQHRNNTQCWKIPERVSGMFR